jgi:hypothetical protein
MANKEHLIKSHLPACCVTSRPKAERQAVETAPGDGPAARVLAAMIDSQHHEHR